jgi:hypothetical protein
MILFRTISESSHKFPPQTHMHPVSYSVSFTHAHKHRRRHVQERESAQRIKSNLARNHVTLDDSWEGYCHWQDKVVNELRL